MMYVYAVPLMVFFWMIVGTGMTRYIAEIDIHNDFKQYVVSAVLWPAVLYWYGGMLAWTYVASHLEKDGIK
mgnify:CR=1 FL=1